MRLRLVRRQLEHALEDRQRQRRPAGLLQPIGEQAQHLAVLQVHLGQVRQHAQRRASRWPLLAGRTRRCRGRSRRSSRCRAARRGRSACQLVGARRAAAASAMPRLRPRAVSAIEIVVGARLARPAFLLVPRRRDSAPPRRRRRRRRSAAARSGDRRLAASRRCGVGAAGATHLLASSASRARPPATLAICSGAGRLIFRKVAVPPGGARLEAPHRPAPAARRRCCARLLACVVAASRSYAARSAAGGSISLRT